MLDNTTKQKIDTLRDILVGKVSDPKSQVEQITIALFYKFMWDMDNVVVELGGKPTHFSDDYARYSWDKLLDPSLGGEEVLSLYKEAVEKMENNPHIPDAFRDIFRRAYLPYNDPSTLRMFLKVVNDGFHYSHSEMLGDAFEYLLSILGTQGDAGQFRTPRHIIDFITECVNPQKSDIICDPSCGTAGFIISAYKHILKQNTDKKVGDKLSPSDRKKLGDNLIGLDIDPMMVKLALANMYLHGFQDPDIFEYDSLTNEDRWNDTYDVVLANPPFMTPKGGIRPHKRFTTQANKAEVLFVDLIATHLSANGRAGIIVPNGIVATTQNSYKNLRKLIIEDSLIAVISLPAGVFEPYSGVKTSLLILDKAVNKKTDNILFVKVDNDGYDLGKQRRPINKNDLPNVLASLNEYKTAMLNNNEFDAESQEVDCLVVEKKTILENRDVTLSGDRYRKQDIFQTNFLSERLENLVDYHRGVTYKKSDEVSESGNGVLRANNIDRFSNSLVLNDIKFIKDELEFQESKRLQKNDILICSSSGSKKHLGKVAFSTMNHTYLFGGFMGVFRVNNDNILPKYLYINLTSSHYRNFINSLTEGTNINNLKIRELNEFQIPLPPLKVQEQIVAEIESYQRIIDGACMVVDNHKPSISIKPHWEFDSLVNYCDFKRGPFGGSLKKEIFVKEGYLVYEQNHAINSDFSFGRYFITEEKYHRMEKFKVQDGDVLISCSGTMGKIAIIPNGSREGIINQALLRLRVKEGTTNSFVKYYLESETVQKRFFRNQEGSAIQNVASVSILKEIPFPKICMEEQKEIIDQIEQEQQIVNANKQLITIYEQKIQKCIAQVWGE